MKVSAQQYAAAWYELLKEAPEAEWDKISEQLLTQLRQDGNMRFLSEIVRLVETRSKEEQGITPVTVRSAHELDSTLVKEQVTSLLPNTEVEVTTVIDDSLIAGLQIETTNERWDLSLKGQLRSLSNHITN